MSVLNNNVVLEVLQLAYRRGIADVSWGRAIYSDLPRWKRVINWLCASLADQPAFIDTANYYKCEKKPLHDFIGLEGLHDLEQAMQELAGTPVCKHCGSTALIEDPSGYYEDAFDWGGAPLLCTRCTN